MSAERILDWSITIVSALFLILSIHGVVNDWNPLLVGVCVGVCVGSLRS